MGSIEIGTPTLSARSKPMSNEAELTPAEISAVIEMALSDHIAFAEIEAQFGLSDKQVKVLMRDNLKPSSYRTWRKRVRTFGDRREHYK